jgi:choloylglycine hydrolase
VNNASDVLNLSQHIINNVDIPSGIARAMVNGKESADYTQWVDFKDLTHKIFYYRTYGDMTLHQVTMSNVDLSDKGPRLKMPLAGLATTVDETNRFIGAKPTP